MLPVRWLRIESSAISLMPPLVSAFDCWSLEMGLEVLAVSLRLSEDWPFSPPWLGDFWPLAAAAAAA